MSTGIYKITNQINNKVYIGQSRDIEKRLANHKTYLRGNYHYNTYLQNSYNKYGEKNFKFEILKICKTKYLDRFEKLYIKIYDAINLDNGYNLEKGGNTYKIVSKQTKQKMCDNHADFKKDKSPLWKEYPTIMKNGFYKGKQVYSIDYHSKCIKSSIDLEYIQKFLEINYLNIIMGLNLIEVTPEIPRIVKDGKNQKNEQNYSIKYNGKIIKTSKFKDKLEIFLKDNYKEIINENI